MISATSSGARMIRWGAQPIVCLAAQAFMVRRSANLRRVSISSTCHDGFTLNDLVSYNHKHNEDNGEDNRDGCGENRSWNCGFEGPTDDPVIERLRNRQVKNFLTAVMLSAGVPMFVMGDEVRRSQRGNNNAYCQDNDTSWFDWNLLSKHSDVVRFVKLLIERRMMRDVAHERWRISLSRGTPRDKTRLAWRETQSAGLVVLLAQHRNRRGIEERTGIGTHHFQCVLGTPRLRTSGVARR